jgi:hypothetical protein
MPVAGTNFTVNIPADERGGFQVTLVHERVFPHGLLFVHPPQLISRH